MAIQAKKPLPPFSPSHLESIAKVLGETSTGLTGSEIGQFLRDCKVPDVDPAITKWQRLYNALAAFQNAHQFGNHVIRFILVSMDPARYTGNPEAFTLRRQYLNEVLAFCGLSLGEDGKVRHVQKASSLEEAYSRASRLKAALVTRGVHADVLRFCTAEVLSKDYFHAVEEALKSVTSKMRTASGLTSDGSELVAACFQQGKSAPLLAISDLKTDTQRGEQRAFVNLLTGVYGLFRNPLAHNARIEWAMTEQDALDIMTLLSLVHRKLDRATTYVP